MQPPDSNAHRKEKTGIVLTERGVDSGRSPSLINPNQLAFATNLTVRGGYANTRPTWKQLTLNWGSLPNSGLFQSFGFFNATGNQPQLILIHTGRMFSVDVSTGNVTEFTPPVLHSNPDGSSTIQPVMWQLQADRFLIIQDSVTDPVFYDGATSWRGSKVGSTQPSLPAGFAMAYAQGRIWVANGMAYAAGDIIYDQESGTTAYNFADSILYNTENQFLNEGGAFGVPSTGGNINAMAPLPTINTAFGQGPLAIFCPNMIFSNDAPTDKTLWKDLTYPVQVVAEVSSGAASFFSVVPVQGDLFYRSYVGVQSFKVADRRFADAWGNVPLSREVKRALDSDQQDLLQYGSAVFFDNRYLLTCSPQTVPNYGVVHKGLVALDFDVLSAMDQLYAPANRVPPAWDGLWTGLNILRIVTGTWNYTPRCFAAVLNSSNQIEIWELGTDSDPLGDNQTNPVGWSFETKAFDFGDMGGIKELQNWEGWLDEIKGEVTLTWKYRPDQDPQWYTWGTKNICQTVQECFPNSCQTVPPTFPVKGYKARTMLGKPIDPSSDGQNQKPVNLAYEFQFRCEGTGHMRMRMNKFTCIARDDRQYPAYEDALTATCWTETYCPPDDFTYQIPD